MGFDENKLEELIKIADSYISLSELAEKLKLDYQDISQKYENQSKQLEQVNIQLSEALVKNSELSLYLNNILECLNAGVIVFDTGGRINLFNKAAEMLTGITRERALSAKYTDIFSGDEHKSTAELLKDQDIKVSGEKWYGKQPVGYSSNRIYNEQGKLTGVVEILHDLSSEKKLRETISHVSALAAVGEMTATVAHQVRNPLAGIIGFTDLLQRDLASDHPSQALAQKISRGARELNKVIANLMEFTRKTKPDFRELDLIKFIHDTVDQLKNEHFAGGVKFEIQTKLSKLKYKFDPILFNQAVINIAQNACQAMEPNGGVLSISVYSDNEYSIKIEFKDTGKGFSVDNPDELFKPFYTTRANGTGLGLSIVKKVIDFHNGSVAASCPDNGGAVFVIELPL